MTTGLGYFAAS